MLIILLMTQGIQAHVLDWLLSPSTSNTPFGWGTCSDKDGTTYQLDGGWRKSAPKVKILYASGGDDRVALLEAIKQNDIVILDGSKGDFVISSYINLSDYALKNKSILGRNNARLFTQWHITPELKQVLTEANLNQYSSSSGTGGTLSNGRYVDEERELHTRQTIIDYSGDNTEQYRYSGFLVLGTANENIIIRNLTFAGPGCVDVGGADLISNYGATHVWIDHCEFIDGMDGNLDSGKREGSEQFVTYSWNIFRYTERSFSHPYSNGVGWNRGYLQYITYAYNIWGEGCRRRLPQADWVYIHLLNNYYTCINNAVAIAINANSHALVEGNYAVEGVNNPFVPGEYADTYYITRENIGFGEYDNASNTEESLEVPYSYDRITTTDLPEMLTGESGAGATLSEEDMDISGIQETPQNSIIYALTEGQSITSGTAIGWQNFTLTFGETGGPDFQEAISWPLDVFTAYTPGNGVNGNKPGGTFYQFAPKNDGRLTVGVKQNKVKPLYVEEDGTPLPDYNGITLNESHPDTYTFTFDVKSGSIYKLYCSGSKLGFYGFVFHWDILYGDVNGDGQVTITDAVGIVNKILGNPSANFVEPAADVNHDGNITITDAVGVVNIILNSSVPPE